MKSVNSEMVRLKSGGIEDLNVDNYNVECVYTCLNGEMTQDWLWYHLCRFLRGNYNLSVQEKEPFVINIGVDK